MKESDIMIVKYTDSFIKNYEKLERKFINVPVYDDDFVSETKEIQNKVILNIKSKGFIVEEILDSLGNLTLKLSR